MKSYGTAWLKNGEWTIDCEPHVLERLKRVFPGQKKAVARMTVKHTPEVCRDLEWFADRYPIDFDPREALAEAAARHRESIARLADLVSGHTPPPAFDLAFPPREYQAKGAAILLEAGSLLLADELGLGKTCTAIATFCDPRTLPAVVVVPAHLQRQWLREVQRFAPQLLTHILKKASVYELPEFFGRKPDVLITTYHKLSGWAAFLAAYCRSIVFDEVHELRTGSAAQKYIAAREITKAVDFRLGMSATPVFNYGAEIFNILDALRPGCLGTHREFVDAWCTWGGEALTNPKAFGAYLADEGLMIRRTRAQVGRELPPLTQVVQEADTSDGCFTEIEGRAAELAQLILSGPSTQDSFAARAELDWKLRQATGIAKAKFVASFVAMLVESGEPVVLCGWHHAVYALWVEELAKSLITTTLFTGQETAAEKDESIRRFLKGDAKVFIMSLRAGAGLDGLQGRASVIVFGEIDWSPAIHEQCIGRLNRDGQHKPVLAYFLVADEGSDPVICEVLGLKKEQSRGVIDPKGEMIENLDRAGHHAKKLAEAYLKSKGIAAPSPAAAKESA